MSIAAHPLVLWGAALACGAMALRARRPASAATAATGAHGGVPRPLTWAMRVPAPVGLRARAERDGDGARLASAGLEGRLTVRDMGAARVGAAALAGACTAPAILLGPAAAVVVLAALAVGGEFVHRMGDAPRRADTAGARDEHAGGGGRQRIGRRERHVVGHGPDGLHLRRHADAVSQIEHATRLATRRIDVEQDRSDLGAGERGVQLRGDTGVAGETRFGLEARGSAHQRAVDRDDGNLADRRPRRAGRRRVTHGRGEVGEADARTEHGEDDVEFRPMNRQRHAEQARSQMR